jgi:hypothetical protein
MMQMSATTAAREAHASPYPRALAALALHHAVAFLDETLAFAVLAGLLLLDVGAFFIGHGDLLISYFVGRMNSFRNRQSPAMRVEPFRRTIAPMETVRRNKPILRAVARP